MSVLIFVENWDGKFKKLSFELISYGVSLAEMTGKKAVAMTIGEVEPLELEKLAGYGVERIIRADNEQVRSFDSMVYTSVISTIADREGAGIILFSNNNTGKALAPRLSVRLKAGIGSGVSKLPSATEPFTIYKKVFSGNAFANVTISSNIKILTLAQNSFEIIARQVVPVIENYNYSVDPAVARPEVIDVQKQTGKILLTDAEIVISGGRGMKSGDNWAPIIELAELLGAATACSRPVSDEGWRPHEEHTGQTGKIIAPNLYFAIGISGATQHLAGVSSSKVIVAINTDKDAPIFSAAQYGIVGDAAKVLPAVVARVRDIKGR